MRLNLFRYCGGLLLLALLAPTAPAGAQQWLHDDGSKTNKSIFRLLDEWPDPNDYRNAAGLPGPNYWQQQADYDIDVTLDTVDHVASGSERITYHNNSPGTLRFLWIQLDQNTRSLEHSRSYQARRALPLPHDRIAGIDTFGAADTFQLQAGSDIYAGGAHPHAVAAVHAAAKIR